MSYVEDMRAEAAKRREEAKEFPDKAMREWYLARAAFFEACAADAEKKKDEKKPVIEAAVEEAEE